MVVAQIPRIPQESAVAPNLNRRPLGAQSQVWLFDALGNCQRGVSNRNLSTANVMRAEKKYSKPSDAREVNDRHSRLPIVLMASSFLFGCVAPHNVDIQSNPVPKVRSVVWLVCEDQSMFMPIYGDSTARMPHLEALAKDGTIFDSFYSVAPVCAPSRSSILTGFQPALMGSHHMRAFQTKQPEVNTHTGLQIYSAPAPPGIKAFTEYLRVQGVYCTNNAKEDYNFKTPPLAWDESSTNAHWRNRPSGAPFFSVFNFNVCHESQVWNRADQPCDLLTDRFIVPPLLPENEHVRDDLKTNYCNLEALDKQIGEIISQLREDGLYDETTIVFYSDHGGPFPRFKRALTDAGLRVPLVIKWGSDTQGPARNKGMFSFLDLAPSVLAWMGISPPPQLPGTPITPLGQGNSEIHGASDRFDEISDRVRTIRTAQWRLIRNDMTNTPAGLDLTYRKQMRTTQVIDSLSMAGIEPWRTWKTGQRPRWELYHTSEDPWELTNLSGDTTWADTLISLKKKLNLAFPESSDLGAMDEASMISMFHDLVVTEALEAARLSHAKEGLIVSHSNPNVSLGWRVLGESNWHITASGRPISAPKDAEVLELIASRIGWPSKISVVNVP
jgi:N-sulfoglucosamine sulfohydrolase